LEKFEQYKFLVTENMFILGRHFYLEILS